MRENICYRDALASKKEIIFILRKRYAANKEDKHLYHQQLGKHSPNTRRLLQDVPERLSSF